MLKLWKEYMVTAAVAMVLAIILGAMVYIPISNYFECRNAGFSMLYCATH